MTVGDIYLVPNQLVKFNFWLFLSRKKTTKHLIFTVRHRCCVLGLCSFPCDQIPNSSVGRTVDLVHLWSRVQFPLEVTFLELKINKILGKSTLFVTMTNDSASFIIGETFSSGKIGA